MKKNINSTKYSMIKILVYTMKVIMQVIYDLFKLLPVKNRVCFLSRQSDKFTRDFSLLKEELKRISPETEYSAICHRFRDQRDGVISFGFDQVRSLYLLATSEVCVLDAYWPTVCMLRHRKELLVIQLWHSVGKVKRSGYQTLGMASGRNEKIAKLLCMHRNYTYIISGGKAWTQSYCEAFDVTPDKLRHYGLPRLDWLLSQHDTRQELEEKYPELKGKPIVLYAPTYRKCSVDAHAELDRAFENGKYALIFRFHPNQRFSDEVSDRYRKYDSEDIFKLLHACDYLITDYSSLALEAAALGKKTLYYLFDHDKYLSENGLNMDPAEAVSDLVFERASELYEYLDSGEYDLKEFNRYREEYLPADLGHSSEKIAALINQALQ